MTHRLLECSNEEKRDRRPIILGANCFVQSELVRPALAQPEKEAFIASCIADATPPLPARKPRY